MSEKIISIVAVIIAFVAIVIMCALMFKHWPKEKLSPELIDKVKTYGLMHFTLKGNIEIIMREGLVPGKKPMSFLETGMVWTYIANPETFQEKLKEIHSKGERSAYDAVIYFRNFTDENFTRMRFRANPEAIVYIGVLKTDTMEAKII